MFQNCENISAYDSVFSTQGGGRMQKVRDVQHWLRHILTELNNTKRGECSSYVFCIPHVLHVLKIY